MTITMLAMVAMAPGAKEDLLDLESTAMALHESQGPQGPGSGCVGFGIGPGRFARYHEYERETNKDSEDAMILSEKATSKLFGPLDGSCERWLPSSAKRNMACWKALIEGDSPFVDGDVA